MEINYLENHSMDKFHNDENIQKLVGICLKYNGTFIFDDIIGSITVRNKESVVKFLNEAETKYVSEFHHKLFLILKQCILNLFNSFQIKNLKGAFLEVLACEIFNIIFKPHIIAKDCKILIDGWQSSLTVDIVMEYDASALICECKVPSSKFNWEIFKNLLEIKFKSSNYFQPYAVTLDSEIRLNSKIDRIKRTVEHYDGIDEIICIHRENIANF